MVAILEVMERTKFKRERTPDTILCSDMHLREDIPKCWTGDFQKEQWTDVNFISDLQIKYDCPVIHAGDLFHHWKPSPWLLSMAVLYLPAKFYTIYGQHDLPQHNFELRNKSGIYTLEKAGALKVLNYGHYGSKNLMEGVQDGWAISSQDGWSRLMYVWHHMTYISKPFPGATGGMAEGILRKYPQYDLIVTGDNHQSFTVEYEGRRLVNPGNLTRQTADQADYKPRVALWYAEDNTIEWVYLPIQEGVISREHIEVKEQRDKRIEAFVSQLNNEWEIGLSFEKNLEKFKEVNKVDNDTMNIIYKAIEV